MLVDDLYLFNNIAMTNKNIPLPISKSEYIIFIQENVYFRFGKKNHTEFVDSICGTFYLTSLRILYIPKCIDTFNSFYVPLKHIFKMSSNNFLECLCNKNSVGIINFNFKSLQNKILLEKLKTIINNVSMDIDIDYYEEDDNSSDIPYYSTLCNI